MKKKITQLSLFGNATPMLRTRPAQVVVAGFRVGQFIGCTHRGQKQWGHIKQFSADLTLAYVERFEDKEIIRVGVRTLEPIEETANANDH